MAVLYNLEPLAAISLFYDGEKNGVWEGDFIKNEKKRGLCLPPLLREYLENYAYLEINRGQIVFFHPDQIREFNIPIDNGDVHIMTIGRAENFFVGIELDTDELDISIGEIDEENRSIMWGPSDGITLAGLLRVMFVSMLFKSSDKFVYSGAEIDAVLKNHGAARENILPSEGSTQHTSLNFDEENGAFLVGEYDPSAEKMLYLHVVPRKTYEQRKAERFASLSLDELNALFDKEFYGNALHCDFSHALELKLEIIKRLESSGAEQLELAEHYKLAGRCLWALNRLDKAVEWYDKAGAIIKNSGNIEKLAEYYHTMGNFYADTRQWEKSDELYDKEMALRLEHFPDDVYKLGMVYQSRAQFLNDADGDPERVIELCNL
ncbi:MAG: hypothetical protein K2J77_06650, partial [Oscillospiraceae bacterium]|nr:hypothetical protein [Oscillospiraceae bacterium]